MKRISATLALATSTLLVPLDGRAEQVVPLDCSRGGEQSFRATVSAPAFVEEGATFTVRIDGAPSGKISKVGLNHIRDMVSDFVVPTGTTLLTDSLRVVPDTGSANVRAGATASHARGMIRLSLPARVEEGSGYTPPSLEFRLKVEALAGTTLLVGFSGNVITANAFLLGDLLVTCKAKPTPFAIAKTTVVPAPHRPNPPTSR